jgi:hypothetical protein
MTQPVHPTAGIPAVDRYLAAGYESVVGMSSRFAAAVTCGLMRIQTELGVTGPIAEIGTFGGRIRWPRGRRHSASIFSTGPTPR